MPQEILSQLWEKRSAPNFAEVRQQLAIQLHAQDVRGEMFPTVSEAERFLDLALAEAKRLTLPADLGDEDQEFAYIVGRAAVTFSNFFAEAV